MALRPGCQCADDQRRVDVDDVVRCPAGLPAGSLGRHQDDPRPAGRQRWAAGRRPGAGPSRRSEGALTGHEDRVVTALSPDRSTGTARRRYRRDPSGPRRRAARATGCRADGRGRRADRRSDVPSATMTSCRPMVGACMRATGVPGTMSPPMAAPSAGVESSRGTARTASAGCAAPARRTVQGVGDDPDRQDGEVRRGPDDGGERRRQGGNGARSGARLPLPPGAVRRAPSAGPPPPPGVLEPRRRRRCRWSRSSPPPGYGDVRPPARARRRRRTSASTSGSPTAASRELRPWVSLAGARWSTAGPSQTGVDGGAPPPPPVEDEPAAAAGRPDPPDPPDVVVVVASPPPRALRPSGPQPPSPRSACTRPVRRGRWPWSSAGSPPGAGRCRSRAAARSSRGSQQPGVVARVGLGQALGRHRRVHDHRPRVGRSPASRARRTGSARCRSWRPA